MSILGAIIAGVVGTIVITMVMAMAPKMGMPKMDIVGMLGSLFSSAFSFPLFSPKLFSEVQLFRKS
ncbi:MAG: hypothetical protein KJ069_31550 [Anaerolineae bacterium]|nr:hypothetical protein [Anaerolineae bacterium]